MTLATRLRATSKDSLSCRRSGVPVVGHAGPVRRLPTVVVLYGPKGAGKSWVAAELSRRAGVRHVDADLLVLDLLDQEVRPDPRLGWLDQVEAAPGTATGYSPTD